MRGRMGRFGHQSDSHYVIISLLISIILKEIQDFRLSNNPEKYNFSTYDGIAFDAFP